jgi:tetratricopeptide (TPR) repeat protein
MPVAGAGLPMPVAGAGLPMPVAGAGLPMPVAGAGLPMPAHGGPAFAPFNFDGMPSAGAAGEEGLSSSLFDVKGLGISPSADAPAFGEFELPSETGGPVSAGGGGAMGFGEVDLGAEEPQQVQPLGPQAAFTATTDSPGEAQLNMDAGPKRAVSDAPKKSSKAGRYVALAAALFVVGGASLQFTPVGAFGHHAIFDAVRKGEYARLAASSSDASRKKLSLDTYGAARAVGDDLADARKRAPRARALTAYAVFTEFATQARFGSEGERASRAKIWLGEVPPGFDSPYLVAALAAQDAIAGDPARARRSIEAALAKVGKDPLAMDLQLLRGEVELGARDAAAAKTAFALAQGLGGGARAKFGTARALYLAGDFEGARKAVDETLTQSSEHPGALTLRARLRWEQSREDAAALSDLQLVLDGPSRSKASPNELSVAYAAKGWVMFGRERPSEARTAFGEAVKLNQRNVWALVGQGEILFADGRFTEALTRFDEAVQKEPGNVEGIVGSAKTKIQLERLKDAKEQLAAAFKANPKDARLALWLGKVEESLGNKTAAEQRYNDAIALADPKQVEAVRAYAALASLLASQGRASEAQAKLEQATAKLPPSATLERALGEVAAAQGHYEDAVSHFETALNRDPKDIGAQFRLAVTLRKMRKMTEAEAEFDKVIAADKDYPGLALERGILYEESGRVDKALEAFKSALAKAPGDLDLQLRVGASLAAIGAVDEAIPMIKKVMEQRTNSAEANHFMGRAYLKRGGLDVPLAMKYLSRAVELDPNRAEYHLYVAWAANDSNPAQLGLARAHVDKALGLDRLLADAYWQRGVVERRQGAIEDALKDLKRALELKPSRNEAHAMLAECYEEKNDIGTALAEWARAIGNDDKQPFWRYRYGKLLLDRGNAQDAAKHLTYAVNEGATLQPRPGWFPSAQFEVAEAMRRTGRRQDAVEHYKLFLQLSSSNNPDRKDALRYVKELGGGGE